MKNNYCPLYLLVACLTLMAACSQIPEQKEFPQGYQLTSLRVPLRGSLYPSEMDLINDFLIICSHSSIHIYSVKNYSFTSSLGYGKQPDSFQLPQFVRSSTPHLYVMEVNNKNVIKKYQIDSLGQPILLQTSFSGVVNPMHRPYIMRDSVIVYDEFIPEASLKIHNLHTNTEVLAMPYGTTSLDDRFFDKNIGGLYANDSCMAFAYKYQDRIDFYDWQFNLKQSINHQQSESKINPLDTRENISYYGYSYMGRNYFYTLYRGVSNELFRSDSLLINTVPNIPITVYGLTRDILEVYDLDGQPVCRYSFTDVAPSVFVVDEQQNRLLGHRASCADSLLVFQLQGLPKNGKPYHNSEKASFFSLPHIKEPDTPKEVVYHAHSKFQNDVAPTYYIRFGGADGRFFIVTESGRTSQAQIRQK